MQKYIFFFIPPANYLIKADRLHLEFEEDNTMYLPFVQRHGISGYPQIQGENLAENSLREFFQGLFKISKHPEGYKKQINLQY